MAKLIILRKKAPTKKMCATCNNVPIKDKSVNKIDLDLTIIFIRMCHEFIQTSIL
jgi:hypothetical protein